MADGGGDLPHRSLHAIFRTSHQSYRSLTEWIHAAAPARKSAPMSCHTAAQERECPHERTLTPPRSINVRPASFIGFSPFLRMASLSSCSPIRRTSRRVPAVVLPKESCARETAHEVKRKRRLSIICSCWPFKTKTAMLISYSFR
jgi:hypothetical protein